MKRLKKYKLYVFAFFFLSSYLSYGQRSNSSSKANINVVGFSSYFKLDKSRPSSIKGEIGRNVQINMWYPAQIEKEPASSMVFSDYLKVKAMEDRGETKPNIQRATDEYFQWPISQGGVKEVFDSAITRGIQMEAIENLDFAVGKFPLILLMHGSAIDFAFLGEYLAKQGYVVVNVPFRGYLKKELDVNGLGMETQIRDYEFALSHLSSIKNIDINNIAVVGFSFGGQSAVGLACRNPTVKAIISYDGGIGTRFGARLVTENPFCGTENITASLLHIYDASYSQNYLDKMKSFVYAERTLVGLDQIAHWHFTSFGYLANQIPNLFGQKKYSKRAYETILKMTLDYLQSKMGNHRYLYEISKEKHDLINSVEQYQPMKK